MAEIVRRGCLLLADISGYTAFVGGVELEHAHDILADLLSMVAREISCSFIACSRTRSPKPAGCAGTR